MKTMLSKIIIASVLMGGMLSSVQANVNELYKQSCATCHAAGVLGAPKSGDKAAWAKLMQKGMPALVQSTKNGYKNMPARGLCDSCTDADYAALIGLMSK
ncbi:MAG: c-type cytochrome [Pseudomonadota bacterium]|nr:c-type cytochrome [Pseudomonadota bacterium]